MLMPSNLGSIVDLARDQAWEGPRLLAEIERRAAFLQGLGVAPNSRTVIAQAGSAEFFADLLAVWRLGGCAVCANPGLSAGELETVLGFVRPAAVLVESDFAGDVEAEVPLLCAGREAPAGGEASSPEGGTLDDPALILFTSGTTGDPKGVVLSFRSLLARLSLNRAHIGDAVLARTLCLLPVHFGHGLIGNCLTPLFAGHRLVLRPGMDLKAAAGLAEVLDEQEITFMSSVPALWKLALRLSRPPKNQTLRQVSIGSAPLSAELWETVIAWSGTRNVVNMYGITEAANWIAGASAADFAPADGLVGRPWGGTLALRDEAGRLRSSGQGELVVQSPSLMQGYARRPDLTAKVLRAGALHSGDLGEIDERGVLRLIGRSKDEINRAGIKVQPDEVDLLLERHPDVLEACSFALPDEVSGELVAAAVTLAEGAQPGAERLRDWCLERMRREAIPERWFFLEALPRSERGKVRRAEVRDHCLANQRGEGGR